MSNNSGGIGFLGLLTIVFITLKLCGVITWSWWWVTAPLWGGLAALLAFLVAGMVLAGVIVGGAATLNSIKKLFK